MTKHRYQELVENTTRDAYSCTLKELDLDIDTGYDCRRDFFLEGDHSMVYQCNVVLGIFEAVYKERMQVLRRKNKIAETLSDMPDTNFIDGINTNDLF